MYKILLLRIKVAIGLHCLLFFAIPDGLKAQQLKPIHAVVQGQNGQALSAVTVQVKGKSINTLSNTEGYFALSGLTAEDVLLLRYLGYEPLEIKVAALKEGQVLVMTEQQQVLQEVTISTGYQELPPERATGSFDQISQAMMEKKVGADILSRLEDQTPGLLFDRRQDGSPKLDLRSRSTIFADDQPLIVLDNFPYDGDINNINPNDIESVNILKDAAAASIWGVRAGNGVIVITTKKGRLNQAMKLSFNSNLTIGERPRLFKQATISSGDFIELEKFLFSKGYYTGNESASNRPGFTPVVELLMAKRDGKVDAALADAQIEALKANDVRNDELAYLYQNSFKQQYALSLNGGGTKYSYYFSAGYDQNRSTIKKNNDDRLTLRTNQVFRPAKGLEFSTDLIFTGNSSEQNGLNQSNAIIGKSYPYARFTDNDGQPIAIGNNYRQAFTQQAQANGLLNWDYNPITEIGLNDKSKQLNDFRWSTAAKYTFIKGLNAELRYAYQHSDGNERSYYQKDSYYARNLVNTFTLYNSGTLTKQIPEGGILDQMYSNLNSNSLRGQLNYDAFKNEHRISAIAGMEVRGVKQQQNFLKAYGINSSYLVYNPLIDYSKLLDTYMGIEGKSYIDAASPFKETFDASVSYYANAAYTYKNTYTFSSSARIDQANIFGVNTNQKSVPLWSAGLSWTLSNEDFFKFPLFTYLKLRSTYGYSGNVDRSLSALVTAVASSPSTSGFPYLSILNPPNPELRWEKIGIFNIGLDFAMKKGILSGSLEYYHKNGTDILGYAPLDATTGITSIKGNMANIIGNGIDVQLNSLNVNQAWQWRSTLNFSYALDEVSKYLLPNKTTIAFLASSSDRSILPVEGRPVLGLYSYPWAGLDGTGDPLGYLADGTVSKDYVAIRNQGIESLIYHGNTRPPYYGSLRNIINWKSFSLSANIAYRFGYYFRRPSIDYSSLFAQWSGHSDYALRWQQVGDELSTNVPALAYPVNQLRDAFYTNSEILVEKGDHIRLQDVYLSYDLKAASFTKIGLNNLQVYLYANNLGLLWRANHYHLDPENLILPAQKTFSLGFKAGF